MASPISIYLPDETLRLLDSMVERQAQIDRENGLAGRQVMSRSKMIGELIRKQARANEMLDIEEITYHVVRLAEDYGAREVSLFGSFARGEQRIDSDIDILLDKGGIRGLQVIDFQEELSRALGRKVDVVTTSGASERFLQKIAKDAITLYKQEMA